jgi:hypothetical protein
MKRRIERLPQLDPPTVPSLGVLLRVPLGGSVCSLARRICLGDESGCLYKTCYRLFGVLSRPCFTDYHHHHREICMAWEFMGRKGKFWEILGISCGMRMSRTAFGGLNNQFKLIIAGRLDFNTTCRLHAYGIFSRKIPDFFI